MHTLARCIDVGFAAQSERFWLSVKPAGLEESINCFDPEAQFFLLVESEW